ncbi:MAG: sulfatase-like hydrolase/transferase [Phycisphaeraceae bacterium]
MSTNVLLIHADQHRFDTLGVNGHPLVRTPHLDGLAREGVNFTHAFTPSAVCTPARASLMTGCWPSQHGCRGNAGTEAYQPADASLPTWSGLLHDAGYMLRRVGKYADELAGPATDFGFDEHVTRRPGYERWRAAQGLAPRRASDGPFHLFGHVDDGEPEQMPVAWEAEHVIRQMREAAATGQPWLVRWDPSEPHLPSIPPAAYARLYDPEAIEPWPSFDDALVNKPYIQRQQRMSWQVEGWRWPRWARTVALYLAEVSLLDAQVGRVLAALDELGLRDETLVVYTTDHGDMCGGHGMVDKHYVMYEDVQRVPLILRGPGLPAGATCDAFVSNEIDLAATLCEVGGVDVPASFEGRSLLAMARGQDASPREDIFAQYSGAQFGLYSQRMVRDRRYKYVWNMTAEDELYDLANDPGELTNLAFEPTHANELARLRRRLVAWMESIEDPALNMWTRAQLLDGWVATPGAVGVE